MKNLCVTIESHLTKKYNNFLTLYARYLHLTPVDQSFINFTRRVINSYMYRKHSDIQRDILDLQTDTPKRSKRQIYIEEANGSIGIKRS